MELAEHLEDEPAELWDTPRPEAQQLAAAEIGAGEDDRGVGFRRTLLCGTTRTIVD